MLASDGGGTGGGGYLDYETGNRSLVKLEELKDDGSFPVKSVKDYCGPGHIEIGMGDQLSPILDEQLNKISQTINEMYEAMKSTASQMKELHEAVHGNEKV